MSQCSCPDSQPQTRWAMTLAWTSSRYAATAEVWLGCNKHLDSILL